MIHSDQHIFWGEGGFRFKGVLEYIFCSFLNGSKSFRHIYWDSFVFFLQTFDCVTHGIIEHICLLKHIKLLDSILLGHI